jgi:NitT/TauT family transport system ATP-binding protein
MECSRKRIFRLSLNSPGMKLATGAEVRPVHMAEASPKLRLTNVTKTFGTATQTVVALEPFSLDIQEGELVVLFGPSGCGKTTILNMIAGFDEPTSGEITLEGRAVTGPGSDRLMMFQEAALFPWLNVLDNVMYGLKRLPAYRFRSKLRREKAEELLRMMHLEEFADARIHELSGGMKQRAALARALAPDPKVLLIDEPFPALDALVRAKLYTELQDLLVKTRKTIVAVTHDPREAACLGDRVMVFTPRPGRCKAEFTIDLPRPRDVNDPKVAECAASITAQLETSDESLDKKAE